ncbi:MAG: hypothetical protein Q9202_002012 [Teloschistes flavicans]
MAPANANVANTDTASYSDGSQEETYSQSSDSVAKTGFLKYPTEIPDWIYRVELQRLHRLLKPKILDPNLIIFLLQGDEASSDALKKFRREVVAIGQRCEGWLGDINTYDDERRPSSVLAELEEAMKRDRRLKSEMLWHVHHIAWTHTITLVKLTENLRKFTKRLAAAAAAAGGETEVVKDGMETVAVLADKTEEWMSEIYEFAMNLDERRD